MECLAVPKLPDGSQWVYQIKLDGYRVIALKSCGKLNLFSKRRNPSNRQYSLVFEALADLPDNTVIDGEVVALDESGRPDFNLLQHYRAEAVRIHYFVFDLLVYDNRDLTQLSLVERRQIMKAVLKFESPRIRITDYFEASVEDILSAARGQGLEGVVAKRKDSRYEIGKRSGSWAKYRLNSGQELVIGGYIPGHTGSGRHHCRILPGRGSDLRRASSERLCPSFATPRVRQAQASADLRVSVRQSPRDT